MAIIPKIKDHIKFHQFLFLMENPLKMQKSEQLWGLKGIDTSGDYDIPQDCNIGTGQQPVWLCLVLLIQGRQDTQNCKS